MAQYGLDRVLSVAGSYAAANTKKGITAGQIAFYADQITDPSLSFTSETEDIVDAMNNVVMVLQNGRGASFSASNAFFNTQLLAAQTGGEYTEDKAVTFTKYDPLVVGEGGKVTLSVNPDASAYTKGTGETYTFNGKVFKLNKDGSLMSATEIATGITFAAATPADGDKAAVPASLTIADLAKGDKVLVVYTANTVGDSIVALADGTNELMNVTAEVLLRDICDESLVYAYLVMRGKLSGETEWGMTRDGNHGFEITCLPSYCADPKELVEVIIVRGEDQLNAPTQA